MFRYGRQLVNGRSRLLARSMLKTLQFYSPHPSSLKEVNVFLADKIFLQIETLKVPLRLLV